MNIGSIVSSVANAVNKTPIGGIHTWTKQSATNSKVARELLRLVVYTCVGCMIFTVGMAFRIILEGKMDAASGTVIGGMFTLFGGVLVVTIPAFAASLNATDYPPSTPPPTNTPTAS